MIILAISEPSPLLPRQEGVVGTVGRRVWLWDRTAALLVTTPTTEAPLGTLLAHDRRARRPQGPSPRKRRALVLQAGDPAQPLGVGPSRLVLGPLASDSWLIDPSQEHAYEDDQMLRDKVGELAAEWANEAEVRSLLQQLLDRPFDDVLGVGSIFPFGVPFGGLLDRHIVQLDALASDLKSYFVVSSANYSYAMHVWLFHLLGGRRASLTAPTDNTRANFTRAIGKMCQTHADSHRSKLVTLQKEVTRLSRTGGPALTRAEIAHIAHASSRATVLVQAVRQKLSETDNDDQASGSVKRDLSGGTPSAVEAKRPARALSMNGLVNLSMNASALQCHEKLGFVHIPKTGGSTVVLTLQLCNLLTNLQVLRSNSVEFHETAQHQRTRVTAAEWDKAYTFAIVRNPYSLAVSQFFYNLEVRCDFLMNLVKPACKYRAQILSGGNRSKYVYRPEHRQIFSAWLMEHDRLAAASGQNFMWPNRITRYLHSNGTNGASQLAWLTDEAGGMLVRRVIRLEDVSDFASHASCQGLQRHLCVHPKGAHASTEEARHIKASAHAATALYYTPEGCEVVRRRFAIDFEAFGYDQTACGQRDV